uniref:Uncharacterized protein n=1 Tax=viral metagenome TaxID=1070528 RepID=A0A6C0JJV6_9ZZZZ
MSASMKNFHYKNHEHKNHGHAKTMRSVKIVGGKGHKSVSHYKKGKKVFTMKRPLTVVEIVTIRRGQFIPKLFSDMKHPNMKKGNKTRRNNMSAMSE